MLPLSTDCGCSATTSEPGRASLVAALDQQPLRLLAGPGALQGEAAAQLLAVEDEDGVAALERLRPGDPAALLVAAAVPDDHAAVSDRALEVVVGDRVVLDLDGEALDGRVHRRALRDRPGAHHPVDLEAQVEVVGGRGVLLDDEDAGADAADRELLVALDLDALDLDLGDPCGRRALAQERDQLLDRRLGSLGVDEHAAVLAVAHPAHHARARAPAATRRVAEADALHLAAHDRAHRHFVLLRSFSHGSSFHRRRPPPSCSAMRASPQQTHDLVGGVISATGTVRPAERRRVAMRRPGWTAGRISLTRSPSPATVASRSGATKARPQKKAGRIAAGALDRLGGLLHDLEDGRAEAEEGLTRGAGGRRLLADAAQVEAGALQRRDRPLELGRDRDNVVECGDAVGMCRPLARRPATRPGRRQPVQLGRLEIAQRPAGQPLPASEPASRIRTSPKTQVSPSTSNPRADQMLGSSATASSSIDGAIRQRNQKLNLRGAAEGIY